MMQNYQLVAFAVGILGIIISFILLIISVIRHKKILKIISVFLFISFIGTTVGYYYETLKAVTNKVNETEVTVVEKKVTSGNSDDPLIITEKDFYDDANYYYSEFEVKNNSNVEISKFSFDIIFTYEANSKVGTHDEHIFLLDSVIPPNITISKTYLWRKSSVERQLGIKNIKLTKIENVICYVNVNGEEKPMKVEDLKTMLKSIK